MAYSVPLFSTMNLSGIDINSATTYGVATSTNTAYAPEYPQQGNLSVGTTVLGTLDGQWVYCTAATATISKYDVVTISTGFTATQTPTTATYGLMAGVAMATATTGQYFWVMVNGVTPGVNVIAGVAANTALYTSATAGRLAVTPTGFTRIQGIVTTTTSAGTAGTYPGIVIQASVATSQ